METILNAEIKSTSFYFEDHGCLTFDIGFEHQRGHQCMGGYCIGHGIINEDDEEHITGTKKGTEAMARIMWAVGVKSWEDLKGKYCRVKFDEENGRLTSVGHIVKDKVPLNDWIMQLGAKMDIENVIDTFNRQGLYYNE